MEAFIQPRGMQHSDNIASISTQHYEVASMLMWHFINVICPLRDIMQELKVNFASCG